jgi:hypothetical protein
MWLIGYKARYKDPLSKHMWSLQQCPTMLNLCQIFKALTNNLKSFKLYKASSLESKMTLMFCKLEHMCYFNVQAPSTSENIIYSLFVTAKKSWRVFFSFYLKITKSGYETVIDPGFLETPPCYSALESPYEYLKFLNHRLWREDGC